MRTSLFLSLGYRTPAQVGMPRRHILLAKMEKSFVLGQAGKLPAEINLRPH
jgi:hypothetical protein